ncbi:hypothetical protein I203_103317 [Kwoniella mangroviensis CBS 8507]|uniref:uncharacterized protein n=1 Tax=Kwoniella mangroviensis CBS 8507 TaxID=1296122 RepID=UPI003073F402
MFSPWQRSNRTSTDDQPTTRVSNTFDLTGLSDSQDMQIIRRSTDPTRGSGSRDQSTNMALVRRRNHPAEDDRIYTDTSSPLIRFPTTDGTRNSQRQRPRRRRRGAEQSIGGNYGPPHRATEDYHRPSRQAGNPYEGRSIPFSNGPRRMPNSRPTGGFAPGFLDDPRDGFDDLYEDLSMYDPTFEDDRYYDSDDGSDYFRGDHLGFLRVPTVRSTLSIMSGRFPAGPCPRCGRYH